MFIRSVVSILFVYLSLCIYLRCKTKKKKLINAKKFDYFDVNKRIIQIMKEKGYNKNSLAKAMGMAQPTIKQIENNENLPSLKFLFEFKDVFPDINFNWILTGKGNKIDLVGEYDIKHEGVIEYDMDAGGYSMRYHDGANDRTVTDKNSERIDKLLDIVASQQKTIELLAQKGAAVDVQGVAGKAVQG